MLAACSFAKGQDMKVMDMGKQQPQPVIYTCPMHPEIHATKPGNCPKCGMKLVKEKPKVVALPAAPVKKKEDVQMPPANSGEAKKDMGHMQMPVNNLQPVTYTCPMHPEIHATKPGNCPKCGMKLIKEKPKAGMPQTQDEMQMPMKDSIKKMDDMEDMKMANMDMPKANIGNIKTTVNNTPPKTVRYDLYIADTLITFGKKSKRAIAVNGQIPMPTLSFTEGDTAEIYVHNNLNEETSLHWHGLMLPNQYDGVPNLTQMPIMPHTTHLYKFPIIQHGTHWYHSHTGLQEQIGMYGMFIMNKREELNIPTIPLILSEWIDMNPKEVHRSLHAATDWFAVQKGSTQSYAEAIKQGHFKTKVTNEWKRMNAMDLTDVYYDNFLLNGKNQNVLLQ